MKRTTFLALALLAFSTIRDGAAQTHALVRVPVPPAMAWHTPLYNDLKTALASEPIVWLENSILWGQRGTPNYRMMFIGAHYLHSVRFGTPAQKAKARKRVLDLLDGQETKYGHMTVSPNGNEQFVLDPHANFWIASMVALTWGAWESQDNTVIGACTRWWAIHLYYLKKAWVGSGVRIPGTRLKGDLPGWDVDTKVFKLANQIPFKIGPYESGSIVWLKKLLQTYPNALPKKYFAGKLAMPLFFQETADGKLVWMAKPAKLPLTPVDWVKSTGPGKGQFTFGKSWQTPPPF